MEATTFLTDAILVGHEQVVDEDSIRVNGRTPVLRDAANLDLCAVQVRVEKRHAIGGLGGRGLCERYEQE